MKVAFVLIACIPDGDIRIETYEEQIAKLGLENRFLILREGISFARLIGECNLVLRTTNTDGDALTVREALYLGKPVIASDVVERPDGTHLFKNRNADSLAEVIENTLNNDINYLPGSSNDKTRQLQSDVLLLYSG